MEMNGRKQNKHVLNGIYNMIALNVFLISSFFQLQFLEDKFPGPFLNLFYYFKVS